MKSNLSIAIRLTLVCLAFFCGFYTLSVYAVAQLVPNDKKCMQQQSLQSGKQYRYYEAIGQAFTEDKYFWSRPSAVDYNAAGSGGSNKGPSNPEYLNLVQARIDTFLVHNPGVKVNEIPSDIVTASGSGLDPDISVQAAMVQVLRISKIRNIKESALDEMIAKEIETPLWGILGTEKINVLKLNIALDYLDNKQ
jgi:K+-transporting ATPase ATPase C chain